MTETKRIPKGAIVQYKQKFIGMNYIEKPVGLFQYPSSANLLYTPDVRRIYEEQIKENYESLQEKKILEQRFLEGKESLREYDGWGSFAFGDHSPLSDDAAKRFEYLQSDIYSLKHRIDDYSMHSEKMFWGKNAPEMPKYRIFVADAFTVHHPTFEAIKCRYLKCLITSPLDETDMHSRWLQENWVEPFDENGSYKEELYKKLQKKFGFKFKRSES